MYLGRDAGARDSGAFHAAEWNARLFGGNGNRAALSWPADRGLSQGQFHAHVVRAERAGKSSGHEVVGIRSRCRCRGDADAGRSRHAGRGALAAGDAASASVTVLTSGEEAVARPVTMQALPSQSSVQVREAVARPVTMQYLPAQQALRAGDAESRAATLQFLPARRSPAATEAIARAFTVGTLGVPLAVPSDSTVERALSSALHGTQPNPFQRVTLIHYSLAERRAVCAPLRVYDLAGRVVRALVMGEQGAAYRHHVTASATPTAAGTRRVSLPARGRSIRRMPESRADRKLTGGARQPSLTEVLRAIGLFRRHAPLGTK